MLADRGGREAAVDGDVLGSDAEPLEFGAGGRQQVGLIRRADRRGRGEDEPARAAARVLGQLGELEDVAELGRRTQLALADRPRIGIADRDEPIDDLLARETLADLPRDLAGALGERNSLAARSSAP